MSMKRHSMLGTAFGAGLPGLGCAATVGGATEAAMRAEE